MATAVVPTGAAGRKGRVVQQGTRVGEGVLPDEDLFVLPDAWNGWEVLPRRNGTLVPEVDWPGAGAVDSEEQWIQLVRDRIAAVLAAPGSDPGLCRAVRAYLDGAADPLGAGALAALIQPPGIRARVPHPVDTEPVGAWTARHGLAFAVRAAVAAFGVDYGDGTHMPGELRPRWREFAPYPNRPGQCRALYRVRQLVALADGWTYREARAAAEAERGTELGRVLTAFLFPEAEGWVDACLDELPPHGAPEAELRRSLLLLSLDRPEQVRRLDARVAPNEWDPALIAALADGLGTGCVPLLAAAVRERTSFHSVLVLSGRLAHFPTDEAFRVLLELAGDRRAEAALLDAVARYPVRAARLLAAEARGGSSLAGRLLDRQLRGAGALLPALLERLDAVAATDGTAAYVRSRPTARPPVPDAPVGELPALLTAPPWGRGRRGRRPEPQVLTGLAADTRPELCWRDGEREEWARTDRFDARAADAGDGDDGAPTDWAAAALAVREEEDLWYLCRVLLQGPREQLAPVVRSWRPRQVRDGRALLRPVLAKYGLAAVPLVEHVARWWPATGASLLRPVLSVGAARTMARALSRALARAEGRAWFDRHGVAGALLLVPDAFGPPGPERTAAVTALRLVAAGAGAGALTAAADGRYGPGAAGAVAALLDTDPLVAALPARIPYNRLSGEAGTLPQLLLASGPALPEQAAEHVLTMLSLGGPDGSDGAYPGLAQVAAVCTPESLAEFCEGVFEEWRRQGAPSDTRWALTALGWFGDDGTAARLARALADWSGRGAAQAVDALAAIGTDAALRQLNGLVRTAASKTVRERAGEQAAELADALGLTPDQLADRRVPGLGLDADGTARLDYGAREFTVHFDEQLQPYLLDGAGRRRGALPAPGAGDDPALAAAARRRYAALKKDVRALAAGLLAHLERAMVTERTWGAEEFRTLFVTHPLLWHPVRRLLWTADGVPFRIAEDRTFADLDDRPFPLAPDAVVRLAHPLHLGDALGAWSELFADYEILQPFPKLGRPVLVLTPQEAAGDRLHRFEGRDVPAEALLALLRRGWRSSGSALAGPLPGGRYLNLVLSPGLDLRNRTAQPEQHLREAWLGLSAGARPSSPAARPQRLGDLPAVAVSELLAELEELTVSG
ncbi:DUF4132 domain-containing protein [Kitasatospora saccharophila]|uniref:DUF4132 domain-containing protein n=1 Tax=Kitasatospora saccharophila TaxID=407973 RepID=UPI0031DC1DA5